MNILRLYRNMHSLTNPEYAKPATEKNVCIHSENVSHSISNLNKT